VRLAAAGLLIAGLTGAALAATGVIAERREVMKSFAPAVRTMGEMFRGSRPYDAAGFKAAAELIRGNGGAELLAKFPTGSIGQGSQARPEIFSDWAEFAERADQLQLLAAALVTAADRAPNGISEDMRMKGAMTTGGTLLASRTKPLTEQEIAGLPAEHVFHLMAEQCTACHAKFRFPDE
jgi:cytochrome c556